MNLHRPRHAEIRHDIEGRIRSGAWPPGHRVPSEHELMARYGCSRMTVHKALSGMAAAGLIVRKRRSGSFVANPATEETVLAINDIEAEIAATGRAYGYALLGRRAKAASIDEAERLGVAAGAEAASRLAVKRGAPCLMVERRTWQSGAPVTFVQLLYPGDRHQLVGRFGPG